MSYIKQFVPRGTEIASMDLNPNDIISTRPFLVEEKLAGRKTPKTRRGVRWIITIPEVITYQSEEETISFAIDGHHKIRKACNTGETKIACKVAITHDEIVLQKLTRRNHGPVSQLPIR